MVRLYSAAAMRSADRLAAEAGVPGRRLMENAGRAVAEVAAAAAGAAAAVGAAGAAVAGAGTGAGAAVAGAGGCSGSGVDAAGSGVDAAGPVTVLAGKGNNGGDGLVAARYLAGRGLPVEVVLAEPPEAYSGDALANLEALTGGADPGLPVRVRVFGRDISPAEAAELCSRSSVVIDALLGTGAKGPPREPAATLIRLIRLIAAAKPGPEPGSGPGAWSGAGPGLEAGGRAGGRPRPFVLAVDLPSGLDADTGEAADPCVKADATVTLGGVKAGLVQPAASELVGRLYLAPIGLPESCLDRAWREGPVTLEWLLPREAAALLPARPVTGHKGTFGHVWIVAGSPGYSGAAVLAGLGALRAGAGLVTVACPETVRSVVAVALPEALTKGLPQGADGRLERAAARELEEALTRAGGRRALVVGPGLGATPETRSFLTELLQGPAGRLPIVLDADALNALALEGPEEVTRRLAARQAGTGGPPPEPLVLTPHPGEMARLTGRSVPDIQADRVKAAGLAARAWGVVLALKGAGTVVASPEGAVWINATGNPGMATGGSGDVLAGAIGAFLAQGLTPLAAALAGVSAHGLAGDLAAREIGSRGLLASDIAHRLPRAMDIMPRTADYGPEPAG